MDDNPRRWAQETTDDQFWSFQYVEHLQMIAESLEESGVDSSRVKALEKTWTSVHQELMMDSNKTLSSELLRDLRKSKTSILKKIVNAPDWLGPTHPSVIDHMIREVEFMEHEKTPRRIIALWLTDMCGHAAIDAAKIDPTHKKLLQKAQKFVLAFEDIKKFLGQSEDLDLEELMSRVDQSSYVDWLDQEVPQHVDVEGVAIKLLKLQRLLTQYHVESFKLFQEGKLLTIMKTKTT